jgi:hypothetical protein
MERSFGEDFGLVTLTSRPNSWFPVGAMACTVGEQIFVNRSTYRHGSELGRRVLAHELAHVVQKRRGAELRSISAWAAPARWRLEAEAELASECVLRDGRFTCTVADVPDAPRFFGPIGHYYTAYFVMLAAGVDDDTAHTMAYCAQLPDLIAELDATMIAIDDIKYALKSDNPNVAPGAKLLDELAGKLKMSPIELALFLIQHKFEVEDFKDIFDAETKLSERIRPLNALQLRALANKIKHAYFSSVNEIQVGLHCLTGGLAVDALNCRNNLQNLLEWPSLDFGLGIHAYGDAYAHRRFDDPATMYGPPMGHALANLQGKSPDLIFQRADFYVQYGLGLFDIVVSKTASPGRNPAISRANLEPLLLRATEIERKNPGDESAGITLRKLAKESLGVDLHPYRPTDGAIPWREYMTGPDMLSSGLSVSKQHVIRAMRLARYWASL